MRPSRVLTIAFAVVFAVLVLAIGAMLVPTAQAEPFQQMLDDYAAHQLGYMAGADWSVDSAVPTEAIAPAAPVIGVETPEAVAVPEGFSWTDAGIGAAIAVGGMIVLLLLAGAALSLRWHEPPWHWHHGATT